MVFKTRETNHPPGVSWLVQSPLREFYFATTIIFDCSDERARSCLVVDRTESDLSEGISRSFVDYRLNWSSC